MNLVQTELDGGITKVTLEGSFDIAGAGSVDRAFAEIGRNAASVIVDLSDVTFLASTGVHILIRTAKMVSERGGQMVVFNPNKASRKVLHATGVDSIIAIADTEADALSRVG